MSVHIDENKCWISGLALINFTHFTNHNIIQHFVQLVRQFFCSKGLSVEKNESTQHLGLFIDLFYHTRLIVWRQLHIIKGQEASNFKNSKICGDLAPKEPIWQPCFQRVYLHEISLRSSVFTRRAQKSFHLGTLCTTKCN